MQKHFPLNKYSQHWWGAYSLCWVAEIFLYLNWLYSSTTEVSSWKFHSRFHQETKSSILAPSSRSDGSLPLGVLRSYQLSRYPVDWSGAHCYLKCCMNLRVIPSMPSATKCLKAGRSPHLEVLSKSDFLPFSFLRQGLELWLWLYWNLLRRTGLPQTQKIHLALPPEFWD